MGEQLEKVLAVRLGSLADLARLAAALSIPQGSSYMLKFKDGDRTVVGILGVFRDYYKFYGVPVFYYYVAEGKEADEIMGSNYVNVSIGEERVELSKNPKPGVSIPLIRLAEKPPFIPDLA